MRTRPVGRRALLVEVDDAPSALDLALWARAERLPVEDVVPAARTVLFDGVGDPIALGERLLGWTPGRTDPAGDLVEIPVRYDGPDLADVASTWGTDPAGVGATHAAVEFVAAFSGFAPGFAYLQGLPDELAVSRLVTPRPRVPAGSVALAGTWCGVYPTASPGGWRIIGTTELSLWDQHRDPPSLLPPGTRVRFVPS